MHHIGSFHLYERHMDMAKNILKEGPPKQIKQMDPMTELNYLKDFLEIKCLLRNGNDVSDEIIDKYRNFGENSFVPLKRNNKV